MKRMSEAYEAARRRKKVELVIVEHGEREFLLGKEIDKQQNEIAIHRLGAILAHPNFRGPAEGRARIQAWKDWLEGNSLRTPYPSWWRLMGAAEGVLARGGTWHEPAYWERKPKEREVPTVLQHLPMKPPKRQGDST